MISKKRHLAKTITWRVLATTDTFLIAWLITGKVDWAAGIASVEVLTKTNSYSIPYDGPAKSAFEKWLPFTKGD